MTTGPTGPTGPAALRPYVAGYIQECDVDERPELLVDPSYLVVAELEVRQLGEARDALRHRLQLEAVHLILFFKYYYIILLYLYYYSGTVFNWKPFT